MENRKQLYSFFIFLCLFIIYKMQCLIKYKFTKTGIIKVLAKIPEAKKEFYYTGEKS